MTQDERASVLLTLEDELLKGGVIVSEWSCFITREADTAFVQGAFLASILTSVAAIETHLRFEYGNEKQMRLAELIDCSDLDGNLKSDLHKLRRYRNKWVHVHDPSEDTEIQTHPEHYEAELEEMALFGIKTLAQTIYYRGCPS